MKLVAKMRELLVEDDPRPTDRVVFNRLKLMVEHEACHPAWGCALYRLHRLGFIDNEQREAGDRYETICRDFRRYQELDPDEMGDDRDWWYAKVRYTKRRFGEAVSLLGVGRKYVDALVLDNQFPWFPRDKQIARDGLQILANFFACGKNT